MPFVDAFAFVGSIGIPGNSDGAGFPNGVGNCG